MPLKIYEYKNCSTCQKALKFLDKKGVSYEKIPIVDQPPTLTELKKMLKHLKANEGGLKNLFNTSGVQYRELGIAEKLKQGMTETQALELLSQNGKLIKRPFAIQGDSGRVGFNEKKLGTVHMKTGILLMNLGTPDAPTPEKVATYLKEFLMDEYVIDKPKLLRWLLVNVLIVPRRAPKSAEAYQKIWTDRGSPLKFNCEDLTAKVSAKLGDDFDVKLAMRYQNPSVRSVLSEWKKAGIQEIKVMPLYPQYARASTLSSEVAVMETARDLNYSAKISYLKPFYRDPGYINAFAENIESTLTDKPWDHLLFSYHGLPERQIKNSDASGSHCLKSGECCMTLNEKNWDYCYRAHCFESSRKMAEKLNLNPDQWSVAFQSRLGVTKWITPYTDIVLNELADKGVKSLVIACPAFTADCLETLEEIEMRANEQFIQRGGTNLQMVPSLNANESWVQAVCELARSANFSQP